MNVQRYLQAEFAEHAAVMERTRVAVAEPFSELLSQCLNALRQGGKILFFGNGGSAADAQHLATELTVRFKATRKAIAAIALGTDAAMLTAVGNDLGFEEIFARQIEALGRPGDVALAMTTSGRSANILRALQTARRLGLIAVAFGGKGGGELAGLADPLLVVPSDVTARIQEMHVLLGHALCEAIEVGLGLAAAPEHGR
jgi:D-sedoheptulose 7-phosphate isomerase